MYFDFSYINLFNGLNFKFIEFISLIRSVANMKQIRLNDTLHYIKGIMFFQSRIYKVRKRPSKLPNNKNFNTLSSFPQPFEYPFSLHPTTDLRLS